MNICQIIKSDTANGPGMRLSLFVSGCTRHCPGCFNPETWDFGYGIPWTRELQKAVLVDGSFVEAKRNPSLAFRGSENQRIIDMRRTWDSGIVTLFCR